MSIQSLQPSLEGIGLNVQVSYTINESIKTEDREYKPLEMIKDNYSKYVATTDYLLQKRNGIKHINIIEFIKAGYRL